MTLKAGYVLSLQV